ncbi:glucose dehydrogenase [FAD, quinone] isoform X1 [Leptinotarsa decemlineata]|uniref:glucose dehydrogenase [FAD, quinone] isoform X1 n=2 Tax=Leptinotarsa decemlineata TaxID=7539 RepID=UPI003D3055E5
MIISTLLPLLVLAVFQTNAVFSPFDFADQYVQEFRNGLNQLTRWADEYKFHQLDFDPLRHNESLAFLEAEEFDFIIVGGGPSGAALANRLSEEPKWRVLLLEAGDAETTITQVPSMHPHLLTTPYTWGYKTTPQKSACLGMIDGRCTVTKAKALGGDSAINDMLFTRGHPRDYDIWSDIGLMGWCWTSVFPFFKRFENALVDDMDKKLRHYGGPVQIENSHHDPLFAEHIYQAGHEIGLHTSIDYNGKEHLGLGLPQVITKNGKRYSAAQAYLDCAHERENLVVLPHSHAIQILISDHTKEASGVKYIREGKLFIVKAAKEVILAAGAINTPHLLMLSGIGPKEVLQHSGIPLVENLCVGCYLKDQVSFVGLNFIFEPLHEVHTAPCDIPNKHHEDHHKINEVNNEVPPHIHEPIHDPELPHDTVAPVHELPDIPIQKSVHELPHTSAQQHSYYPHHDVPHDSQQEYSEDSHDLPRDPHHDIPHDYHHGYLKDHYHNLSHDPIHEHIPKSLREHIHNPSQEIPHEPHLGILHQEHHLLHSVEELVSYLRHGKGPLSTTGLEMVSFVKTKHSKGRSSYPDIQFLFKKIRLNEGCHHLRGINIRPDIHDTLCKPIVGAEGFHIEVILLHPKSTGALTLNDRDPFHHPWINPNALCDEDEEDIETLLAGIHKALKLAESPSMHKLGVKLVHQMLPECENDHLDDEYWRCAIQYLSVTKGNIIGTAKMAPVTVKGGVVDQELRVYGIHKLRVADASVIPVTISGSTMGPEIMIGEHAADLIKKEWLA